MKALILATALVLPSIVSASALAWNNSYDNDSSDRYQGSSGNTYQYDMSNPVDRNRYSTDTYALQLNPESDNSTSWRFEHEQN